MREDSKVEAMMPYIIRSFRANIFIILLFFCILLPFVLRFVLSAQASGPNTLNNTSVEISNVSENAVISNQSDIKPSKYSDSFSMPILMYHHIKPESTDGLTVSVDKFAKQLDYIKEQGFEAITFARLSEKSVPQKSIILTFDDGYDNFYGNVFPLLKERGMTAVAYIIVNEIGKSGYMTREQIKEIADAGVEIGSHTISHPDLTLMSEHRLRSELFDSKESLEELTGKAVISLCYPAGKYNDIVESVVSEKGYLYGLAIHNKIATFDDSYSLERYRISEDIHLSAFLK